jgi:hypothetical protein
MRVVMWMIWALNVFPLRCWCFFNDMSVGFQWCTEPGVPRPRVHEKTS